LFASLCLATKAWTSSTGVTGTSSRSYEFKTALPETEL
jgi:hypothetical protein